MPQSPEIRPLTAADAAATTAVIRAAMLETGALLPDETDAELDDLATAFGAAGSAFFVAALNGQPVGGAGIVRVASGVCELRKSYLAPSARGLGLGRELLGHCLDEARRLGHRQCVLQTMPSMERARTLYERAGFRLTEASEGTCGTRCSVHMTLDL